MTNEKQIELLSKLVLRARSRQHVTGGDEQDVKRGQKL
jgi:hypothetical protein